MARTSSRPTTTTEKNTSSSSKPRRSLLGPIIGVLAVGALVALVLLDPPPPGVEFPAQGNIHLDGLEEPHPPYNSSPPSSGWHMGFLAEWGVSEDAVPPELYIHNLEDRGIVIAYHCPDGCDDLTSELGDYVTDRGGSLLLTPYEERIVDPDGTEYRAAAVAWKRVFYFDDLTDDVTSELDFFVDLYMGIDHHAGSGGENQSN